MGTLCAMDGGIQGVPGIRTIDTHMGGREGVTSAYLVEGERPALVETAGSLSLPAVSSALAEHGVGPDDLAHIVVTHVHLDHAGGAGAFARHFPRATVWAHERGAPHLVDPTKLVRSATRVFGEEHMGSVFGPVEPVAADRVRAAEDGARIDLGSRSLTVVHAPGHAMHHLFLVDSDSGAMWTGDGLGLYLPDIRILRPGTPPPDFDLEQAVASVERVAEREPPVLLFSHFGPATDVSHLCALAVHRMHKWASIVEDAMRETDEAAEVIRRLREGTASELAPAQADRRAGLEDRYELLSSYEMNAMGLMRYVRKAQEAAEERS